MTNKELAVQLYSAILNSAALVASSPNARGTVQVPTIDSAVSEVAKIAEALSHIEDK